MLEFRIIKYLLFFMCYFTLKFKVEVKPTDFKVILIILLLTNFLKTEQNI
jgi:hypothetical protein